MYVQVVMGVNQGAGRRCEGPLGLAGGVRAQRASRGKDCEGHWGPAGG